MKIIFYARARRRWFAPVFWFFVLFFVVEFRGGAQPAHLAYVYPAGGRVGTTFQIVVGGQSLLSVSNAFVSGPGFHATVLEANRPMGQKEFNALRDRLKTLQDKLQSQGKAKGTNGWTAAEAAECEKIRAEILRNPPNRAANPAMMDTVRVRIAIATNVAPGEYEIRLATPNALSNPLRFVVGELPEISKPLAKADNPVLNKFVEKRTGKSAPAGTPKFEARVSLPVTLNGQIMPGGVDRYRFSATRSQRLVMKVSARSLMPYLADAVPGWFESVLTIYDAKGRELASAERFHFRPDPVFLFEVPRDGEYVVALHDSIFRGREDFVYRLTMGELPYVTGIFPLGGRAGEKVSVALQGWNLPEKDLTLNLANAALGEMTLPGTFLNSVPFAVDTLPETREQEANGSVAVAQPLSLPRIVNGRIDRPGTVDVFRLEGHAGQRLVAEVLARRLDSPLDSYLQLTDAQGAELAGNDDFEDKASGLNTHHADAYLAVTLPADGKYYLHLRDAQGQGGPDFTYRLRVSEPRPDFTLRIVPSSLCMRSGLSVPLTVFALRRDGFTNAIELSLKEAPAGFVLSGARLAENQDQAKFTLKAPAERAEKPFALTIQGRALTGEQLVSHPAVPAEDLVQAFLYRHLVPSKELAVMVNGAPRGFQRDAFKILSPLPVTISPGANARIRVSLPPGAGVDRFKLELDQPPAGIVLESVTPVNGGVELVIRCSADPARAGSSGNLICNVLPKSGSSDKTKPGTKSTLRNFALSLPAIPFVIAPE